MSGPAIGGKVLDASALVAFVRHRLDALTWVDVARRLDPNVEIELL